jgi:hypothetical protein
MVVFDLEVHMIPDLEKVKLGTSLVRTGWLAKLRNYTGISRNHLAGLLQSHGNHVRKWESGLAPEAGGPQWIHHTSALRIAALYDDYMMAVAWMESEGLTWGDLVPLPVAAYQLGIAVPTLRKRLFDRAIEPIEFASLGEWILKGEATLCRK